MSSYHNQPIKNKHGRVGVPRTRMTRGDLKKQAYVFGRGVEKNRQAHEVRLINLRLLQTKEFMESLLKMKSANAIHEAIRRRLSD